MSSVTPTSTSPPPPETNPAGFKNPHSLTNKIARLAWRIVWIFLFRPSPPRLGAFWRRFLLTCFGAEVSNAWLHNSVEIWAPWKLKVGKDTYIDRETYLYNPYGITIGDRTVISMKVLLCTPSHDFQQPDFPLIGAAITIGSNCWIAADTFVGPGVTIGDGSVLGARSSAFKDIPPWVVAAGSPAKVLKNRVLTS